MPFTKAVTKLRKGLALLQLQRDVTFAKTCFDETLMLMDRIHVKRVKAECYMGLTLYAIDAEEATAYAELGLHETQKVQDDWMSALLLIALTKSLAEAGQAEEAIERALQAQHYFQQSEDLYGQMIASFWLAYCYRTEDITKGRPYYETFMTICTAQYPFFITKETLFGPTTLLTFCQISEQFNTAKATAHVVKAPQHTLQLTLFGPSMIRRDGQIITDKDWKRMKAKELFLYLYRHRNQFVSRAQLCEAIWAHDEEAMSRQHRG